ncbi:hypothetical protein T069G_00176 [Trichoderma breve]|uniref:Uncharacterized protein n=1 Tax=Trichoderma breve TaxID=2034170 RepID=A0A9W9EBJ9_9HYPO|nr:hypothetical protein T069G_00176 [Trichoderma breve]KAJ4863646.1 hypothetical protein T069G_00176 [Trichoderma breve]
MHRRLLFELLLLYAKYWYSDAVQQQRTALPQGLSPFFARLAVIAGLAAQHKKTTDWPLHCNFKSLIMRFRRPMELPELASFKDLKTKSQVDDLPPALVRYS